MATQGDIAQVTNDSTSSYCKMPDGTLIQWGKEGGYASGNNKEVTVTLPIPFIDTNYQVSCQNTCGSAGSDADHYLANIAMIRSSTSQFIIHVRNYHDSYTNTISWIAIGRWK